MCKPIYYRAEKSCAQTIWQYVIYEGHHKNIYELLVTWEILLEGVWETEGERIPVFQEQYVNHELWGKKISDCAFETIIYVFEYFMFKIIFVKKYTLILSNTTIVVNLL